MRVLVTWGSERGGTEEIARTVADAFEQAGVEVVRMPAEEAGDPQGFDGVVVGGALYANRWHRAARRYVSRHVHQLRKVPVWFFSSGPLDDSADRRDIPPVRQVEALMQRVGALSHVTFGGRLAPDAKGFPAKAMAKKLSGDWRDPERIRAWADDVAQVLPFARPGTAIDPPARTLPRLLGHGVALWALCAALMGGLMWASSTGVALVVHGIAAPLFAIVVARHYFLPKAARAPLPVAIVFAAIIVALDAIVVAGWIVGSAAMLASATGFWLPVALIFLATWMTGAIMLTLPWPKGEPKPPPHAGAKPLRSRA